MRHFLLSFILCVFLSISAPAMAAPTQARVQVNGLICDFCARAIEKVFSKEAAVSSVKVDLDAKEVRIDFKDGQTLDDEALRRMITDSGYSVERIERRETPPTPTPVP
jgi:copper chaperone CopZ